MQPIKASCFLIIFGLIACVSSSIAVGQFGSLQNSNSARQPTARPYAPNNTAIDDRNTPVSFATKVAAVRIEGNKRVPADQIMSKLRTRANRTYDPDLVQADAQEIMRMRFFNNVKTSRELTSKGVIVTFKIVERNFINDIKFIGNRHLTDRSLLKQANLTKGQPLDIHKVKMARQRIEDFYDEKGLGRTEVEIIPAKDEQTVVFLIHEDDPQRIRSIKVVGNTITSQGRLKSFLKSKASVLRTFGGKYSSQKVEQDKQILTAYYRSLGFFNARVGVDSIQHDPSWISLTYVIDEGPRFKIRNVSFVGNDKYSQSQLESIVELKSGDFFHAPVMQQDINKLRDQYGSQGHININVEAEHLFHEQPGVLDLVYKINEGPQYRLGRINVHVEGDHGITRKQVILNRIGLKPGDIIDMRKIRASEIRLGRSQLFNTGGAGGAAPRLVVVPRNDPNQLAQRQRSGFRGQSPDENRKRSADLNVIVR